jgi:hypothetical protein
MTQTNHAHRVSALGMFGLPLPIGAGDCPKMIVVHW